MIRPRTALLAAAVSTVLTAGAVGTGLAATAASAAPARTAAAPTAPGTVSLVELLTEDGSRLDSSWKDTDLAERAVAWVIAKDDDSPVAALADGSRALTAFVPTDKAFRTLVKQLTGTRPATEAATWKAIRSLGAEEVEDVLLVHVVPGRTLTATKVVKADGRELATADDDTLLSVAVDGDVVTLSTPDSSADVVKTDLNKGNRQVAHVIDAVLLPDDETN